MKWQSSISSATTAKHHNRCIAHLQRKLPPTVNTIQPTASSPGDTSGGFSLNILVEWGDQPLSIIFGGVGKREMDEEWRVFWEKVAFSSSLLFVCIKVFSLDIQSGVFFLSGSAVCLLFPGDCMLCAALLL